jgi:hypothetical protein
MVTRRKRFVVCYKKQNNCNLPSFLSCYKNRSYFSIMTKVINKSIVYISDVSCRI